jgi:uncharacterized protein (TIGR03435 family)
MKRMILRIGMLVILQSGMLSAQNTKETPNQVIPMASSADPSFEVATIKPSNPDHPANALPLGHHIDFPNTTVRFLLAFIYDVHDKQIVAAPDWIASEKFDFDGVADAPGTPNLQQIQIMFQNLFADRLQLRFHHEKREMSTYILTVAKSGPKLTVSPDDPTGYHSLLGMPQRGMKGHNLTMADFASRLQSGILDRPVVDQTNLQGKYDFLLKWTPDETQFNQVGARMPPPSDAADAPPGLFTAIQEQLGLKLSPTKAFVDVLVIDHIQRPSEN